MSGSSAAVEGPEWSARAEAWADLWASLAAPARTVVAEATRIGAGFDRASEEVVGTAAAPFRFVARSARVEKCTVEAHFSTRADFSTSAVEKSGPGEPARRETAPG
jgi:hypothetical protein